MPKELKNYSELVKKNRPGEEQIKLELYVNNTIEKETNKERKNERKKKEENIKMYVWQKERRQIGGQKNK